MMPPAETGIATIHGTSFAADIDRAWGRELNRRNLQDSVLILTVVRRQVTPLAVPLLRQRQRPGSGAKTLHAVWKNCVRWSPSSRRELGIKTRRMKISDGSWSASTPSLLTGELRNHPRSPFGLLAEEVAGASAQFGKGVVEIEEGASAPKLAAVLYVKSYANATWPGMLDAFRGRAGHHHHPQLHAD